MSKRGFDPNAAMLEAAQARAAKKSDTTKGSTIDAQSDPYGGITVGAKDIKAVRLRLPGQLLAEVDSALAELPGISRNTWLLLAINEKLKRG